MFKIERTISKEIVEAIIVGALEGGSNYWYILGDDSIELVKDATPEMDGRPFSYRFVEALERGVEIPIYDREEAGEVLLGTISLKTMGERTNNMLTKRWGERTLNAYYDGGQDAGTADIIFQHWVMDKFVFS